MERFGYDRRYKKSHAEVFETAKCPAFRVPLKQNSLSLENLERLFQTCNLGLIPALLRRVCFCSCITIGMKLGKILQNRIQLCLHSSSVSSQLKGSLVQGLELLSFVVDICNERCSFNLILFGLLGVHGDCSFFIGCDLCKIL